MASRPSHSRRTDLVGRIVEWARLQPGRAAIVDSRGTTSWGEFGRRIDQVAEGLRGLGVVPGERVAILASNVTEHVEAFLGAVRAGAVAVPLPGHAAQDAWQRMLEDCGARTLFLSRAQAPPGRPLDAPASWRGDRIALDFDAEGWIPYEAWLGDARGATFAVSSLEDAPFNIIYSSGTTGVPRGIVQSHEMRAFQVDRMGRLGFDTETVTVVATPLCSNATWVALLPTLSFGGTVVLLDGPFDTLRFLQVSERERATHTLLVPILYRRLLGDPTFDRHDLSSYRLKLSTGAAFAPSLKREVATRWPGRLVEVYGVTEGGCTTLLDVQADPGKLDTVGRPAAGVDVRVVDAEGGQLAQGEVGEVVGRAVSMMTGYHGRKGWTEEATWRDTEGRRFVRTGDLGFLDEDGFLHLTGRKKDVVVSGGQNVHPADLERVLFEHEAVEDVAVVGVPSREWGETPKAFVVRVAGSESSAEDIRVWANERLGRTQRLSSVELVQALPRNAAGKVRKDVLRGGR